MGNPEEACKMARQAFEDAIAELDSVSEDSYKVPARGVMAEGSWSLRQFCGLKAHALDVRADRQKVFQSW